MLTSAYTDPKNVFCIILARLQPYAKNTSYRLPVTFLLLQVRPPYVHPAPCMRRGRWAGQLGPWINWTKPPFGRPRLLSHVNDERRPPPPPQSPGGIVEDDDLTIDSNSARRRPGRAGSVSRCIGCLFRCPNAVLAAASASMARTTTDPPATSGVGVG